MLIPSLAKKIIKEVRRLIDEDIIIVDISGTIIASTDSNRLGNFHEGALLASRDQKKIIITKEMEQTLQGVKAGINLPVLFQHKVVGVIGITGNPEKVSSYGELLKKMTELLIQESYYAEQMELDSRTLEAFVFDWLQLRDLSPEFRNRADILGIDVETKRQVVMGSIRNASTFSMKELSTYIQQKELVDASHLFVRWGNDRFLLLLANQPKKKLLHLLQQLKEELEGLFSVSISLGIGREVPGGQLRISFNDAERALHVAERTSSIQFDEELKIEMLLQDISEEVRNDFVQRTITPLLSDRVLLETLKAFIQENQSIKQTAEALHIHVNTLHYRLQKIEELTGLYPRSFTHLATLHIGLLLEDSTKNNPFN